MPTLDPDRATWRKSSHSGGQGNCVEVCTGVDGTPTAVGVRDSKDPSGPVLVFTGRAWRVFVDAVRAGDFDSAQRT